MQVIPAIHNTSNYFLKLLEGFWTRLTKKKELYMTKNSKYTKHSLLADSVQNFVEKYLLQ
jgi:hypothetical protein